MNTKKETIKVVFRKFKDGEIIALFPGWECDNSTSNLVI